MSYTNRTVITVEGISYIVSEPKLYTVIARHGREHLGIWTDGTSAKMAVVSDDGSFRALVSDMWGDLGLTGTSRETSMTSGHLSTSSPDSLEPLLDFLTQVRELPENHPDLTLTPEFDQVVTLLESMKDYVTSIKGTLAVFAKTRHSSSIAEDYFKEHPEEAPDDTPVMGDFDDEDDDEDDEEFDEDDKY